MKILFPVMFLFFWSSISAQALPEYSGSWYNPDQNGHGLNIEVIDSQRSIAYWYTYNIMGNPVWWLLDGVNIDNRIEFIAYEFMGMYWGDWNPAGKIRTEVGTVTVEFIDCLTANLTYTLGYFGDGEIPLERLTHIAGMKCNEVGDLAGDWLATIHSDQPDYWVETTVRDDGTFLVSDALACIWEGQIRVVDEARGVLAATVGSETCGWKVPPFEMIGSYVEPYHVCSSGGQCQTHDAAMGFEGYAIVYPGDGEPVSSKMYLRFVRPID